MFANFLHFPKMCDNGNFCQGLFHFKRKFTSSFSYHFSCPFSAFLDLPKFYAILAQCKLDEICLSFLDNVQKRVTNTSILVGHFGIKMSSEYQKFTVKYHRMSLFSPTVWEQCSSKCLENNLFLFTDPSLTFTFRLFSWTQPFPENQSYRDRKDFLNTNITSYGLIRWT